MAALYVFSQEPTRCPCPAASQPPPAISDALDKLHALSKSPAAGTPAQRAASLKLQYSQVLALESQAAKYVMRQQSARQSESSA